MLATELCHPDHFFAISAAERDSLHLWLIPVQMVHDA